MDKRSKSLAFQARNRGFESRLEYLPQGKHCRSSVRNFAHAKHSQRLLRVKLRKGFDVPRMTPIDYGSGEIPLSKEGATRSTMVVLLTLSRRSQVRFLPCQFALRLTHRLTLVRFNRKVSGVCPPWHKMDTGE